MTKFCKLPMPSGILDKLFDLKLSSRKHLQLHISKKIKNYLLSIK